MKISQLTYYKVVILIPGQTAMETTASTLTAASSTATAARFMMPNPEIKIEVIEMTEKIAASF